MPTLGHCPYAWHVDLHEHMNMYTYHKQAVGINNTEMPTFDLGQVRKPVAGFYWGCSRTALMLCLGTAIAIHHGQAREGELGSGVTHVQLLPFHVSVGLPLLQPLLHQKVIQSSVGSCLPDVNLRLRGPAFCFLSF